MVLLNCVGVASGIKSALDVAGLFRSCFTVRFPRDCPGGL